MNLNNFAKIVALAEGKKRSMPIGQVKEILKIVDKMLGGELYRIVRESDKHVDR